MLISSFVNTKLKQSPPGHVICVSVLDTVEPPTRYSQHQTANINDDLVGNRNAVCVLVGQAVGACGVALTSHPGSRNRLALEAKDCMYP